MSSETPLTIVLIEDHFVVRLGLAASLEAEADLRVVGEAESVNEALKLVEEKQPKLAIVDMHITGGTGIDFLSLAKEVAPETRFLMLSVNVGESHVLNAFRAGAHGYLSKSVDRAELLEAVRCIAGGDVYFPASLYKKIQAAQARPDLSPREMEVLRLVVKGRLNKEISEDLKIAEITVKQHVSAILRKLGVQDRTQAAIASVERGLIRLED